MDHRTTLASSAAFVLMLIAHGAWISPAHAEPTAASASAKAPAPAATAATPATPASAAKSATPATPASAAKSATPATPASAAKARQAEAVRKLAAAEPESVSAGIAALRAIGDQAAQKALIERVQVGLPPAQVVAALDALVAMRAKRALPVITELVQHRRPLVRSQALAALAAIEQRGARATQTVVLSALEDPSADVCAAAAAALGRIGTPSALPALFAAYDRGVLTALPAIADLAGRESIAPLFARMPQGAVEPVEPVLDRMLEGGKLSVADQVAVARKLTELGTPSARRYLLKWLDRIKLQGQARVKTELFQSLKTLDAKPAAPAVAAPAPTAAPATPAPTRALASKGAKR
jgi:hypothetical protein